MAQPPRNQQGMDAASHSETNSSMRASCRALAMVPLLYHAYHVPFHLIGNRPVIEATYHLCPGITGNHTTNSANPLERDVLLYPLYVRLATRRRARHILYG